MRTKNNHRIYKRMGRKSIVRNNKRKSIVRKNKRKSIVRKKQYGGTPPPAFVNILNSDMLDNDLLNNIYKNFGFFIKALTDNEMPDPRLEAPITRSITAGKPLPVHWKGVRLLECFDHSAFNYNIPINDIFLEIFDAVFDAKQEEYLLLKRQYEMLCELGFCQKTYDNGELNTILDIIKTFDDNQLIKLIPKEDDRNLLKQLLKKGIHEKPFIFNRQLGPPGKVGTPYVIKHISTDTDIIMKISNNISLNINVVCAPESNSTCSKCIETQKKIVCFPHTKDIQYIVKSSEFINETIIGYVLNTIFFPKHINDLTSQTNEQQKLDSILKGELLDKDELGNSVYQIGHFQSNDNYGSNIMEKADAELDKLFKGESLHTNEHFKKITMVYKEKKYFGCNPEHKDIIITMLLLQLSNTLKIVADELGMIHGDLKAGNVFFSIKDNYSLFEYPLNDTINIKTNIRLKIADYGKSSIIYKGIRFYCDSVASGVTNTTINWAKDADITNDNKYSTGFGMNILGATAAIKLRLLPCPYFRSFDLYCVIVSLAIQSEMFMQFYIDNQIYRALFVDKGTSRESNADSQLAIELSITPVDSKMKIESIKTAISILNQSKFNGRFKCNGIEECIEKCVHVFDKNVDKYKSLLNKINGIIVKYREHIIDIENDSAYSPPEVHTYNTIFNQIDAITNMTKKLQDRLNNCNYRNLTIESIKFINKELDTIYSDISRLTDTDYKNYICHTIITNLTEIKTNITPFV